MMFESRLQRELNRDNPLVQNFAKVELENIISGTRNSYNWELDFVDDISIMGGLLSESN